MLEKAKNLTKRVKRKKNRCILLGYYLVKKNTLFCKRVRKVCIIAFFPFKFSFVLNQLGYVNLTSGLSFF